MKTQFIIPAAGMGARLGSHKPKALVDLAGKPILLRTLERLHAMELGAGTVVTVPPDSRAEFEAVLESAVGEGTVTVVDGGDERQRSVANALAALDAETDIVVIHDAARPFVPRRAVHESIEGARTFGAATVALPCSDTILEDDGEGFLGATPNRDRMWACQTPQTFRVEVIKAAHHAAQRDSFAATDDASLVRRNGGKVKLVTGSTFNRKITTPADLAYAEHLIRLNLLDSDLDPAGDEQ